MTASTSAPLGLGHIQEAHDTQMLLSPGVGEYRKTAEGPPPQIAVKLTLTSNRSLPPPWRRPLMGGQVL